MHIPALHDLRNPVILAVDDDPNNLAVLRDCLVEMNYGFLVAEDGESAVTRAEYARPDLILLDIMMPGIDGIETCRRLKFRESTKDIPVIFMSALTESGHLVKGLEVGAVDYVTKPFQRDELLARIAVHLKIRELTHRLQESKDFLELRVEKRTAELARANSELQAEIAVRKRAEDEQQRLVTAIEQAAEAIIITDLEWNICYVNPAFERLNGYGRDEIIGQHTGIIKSDRHDSSFFKTIKEELASGRVWSGRMTNRRKDGSCYESEVTGSPVRDKQGSIISFVSIHRDITHEIKLERQLRQSHKMEAIGTLTAGIAHDFNNILTAIVGYTELSLSRLQKSDPLRGDLEQVLESGLRATDLVRQILTFSRQTEQERKPVHLDSIIREVLKLLRPSLPSFIEIHTEYDIKPEECIVDADSTQLHQVLMNLCTNAAHAMRNRGGVLSLTLTQVMVDAALVSQHPGLKPGPHLRLAVSDTGHGIDAALMERIFDPYFTTKKTGEGTGMGLAVTMGIVQNHGGAISVSSESGQGTSFEVFLPRAISVGKQIVETRDVPQTGKEQILFIDDEKALAVLGQKMLETLGYRVTAVTNSLEALELFRSKAGAFDLVITDMSMPGLTGRELARELVALRPDIPVIMCSGFAEFVNPEQAREAGIREFLMKPYVIGTLAKTIRKVL